MARPKRRAFEIFSLSFLDCICCGFGAILLLFFLTAGNRADRNRQSIEDLQKQAASLKPEVVAKTVELKKTEDTLEQKTKGLDAIEASNKKAEIRLREKKALLLLLLNQQSTIEDALKKLMEEKKSIPTVEEKPPIPIPNIERRQYLTGFKLEGHRILFLVEISGGMLDETVDGAIARMGEPEDERRKAPKWQRVVKAVEWMITSLHPESRYQILLFNDKTLSLLPDRSEEWLDPRDSKTTKEILDALNAVLPHGGANLERAFETARDPGHNADSIVLFTDGLPTLSDSYLSGQSTNDRDRERMFRYAERVVPSRVPVNTILFPMEGDPGAAELFWELANDTRGALVSPAKTWPDT